MRRQGYIISRAEVDPGRIGIGAPVLDEQRRLLGSLSYVIPLAEEASAMHLGSLIAAAAHQIESRLINGLRPSP